MQPRQMIQRLMNNISTVIVGKQEVIEYALIALCLLYTSPSPRD